VRTSRIADKLEAEQTPLAFKVLVNTPEGYREVDIPSGTHRIEIRPDEWSIQFSLHDDDLNAKDTLINFNEAGEIVSVEEITPQSSSSSSEDNNHTRTRKQSPSLQAFTTSSSSSDEGEPSNDAHTATQILDEFRKQTKDRQTQNHNANRATTELFTTDETTQLMHDEVRVSPAKVHIRVDGNEKSVVESIVDDGSVVEYSNGDIGINFTAECCNKTKSAGIASFAFVSSAPAAVNALANPLHTIPSQFSLDTFKNATGGELTLSIACGTSSLSVNTIQNNLFFQTALEDAKTSLRRTFTTLKDFTINSSSIVGGLGAAVAALAIGYAAFSVVATGLAVTNGIIAFSVTLVSRYLGIASFLKGVFNKFDDNANLQLSFADVIQHLNMTDEILDTLLDEAMLSLLMSKVGKNIDDVPKRIILALATHRPLNEEEFELLTNALTINHSNLEVLLSHFAELLTKVTDYMWLKPHLTSSLVKKLKRAIKKGDLAYDKTSKDCYDYVNLVRLALQGKSVAAAENFTPDELKHIIINGITFPEKYPHLSKLMTQEMSVIPKTTSEQFWSYAGTIFDYTFGIVVVAAPAAPIFLQKGRDGVGIITNWFNFDLNTLSLWSQRSCGLMSAAANSITYGYWGTKFRSIVYGIHEDLVDCYEEKDWTKLRNHSLAVVGVTTATYLASDGPANVANSVTHNPNNVVGLSDDFLGSVISFCNRLGGGGAVNGGTSFKKLKEFFVPHLHVGNVKRKDIVRRLENTNDLVLPTEVVSKFSMFMKRVAPDEVKKLAAPQLRGGSAPGGAN